MNAAKFQQLRARLHLQNLPPSRHAAAFKRIIRQAKAWTIYGQNVVIGWRMPTGEIVCRKYRHQGEAQALAALETFEALGGQAPRRAYPCANCNGWHLSSMDRVTPLSE